jgi:GT2 family glycosyltransferase
MPRFSVLVLNWNGRDLLDGCLASLRQQTFRDFETILVDNGSSDGSADLVRRDFPEVRLVELRENTGFCGGNNEALRVSTGELVVLLNNDAELDAGFLSAMDDAAGHEKAPRETKADDAADPERAFGMFAACVRMFDRRDVFDSTGLLVYPDGICRSRGWLEDDRGQYDEAAEVLCPNGCAAVYRRTMIDEVGFFDDAYFAYLEDLDLGLRGQLRGWRCQYVPAAVAFHKKSMTSGYHSAFKAFLVERNRIWNAVKLLPLRLLVLSPLWTIARYVVQGYAAASGKGMSSHFRRDYSRATLLGILLRAYASALARLPEVWRQRREIQRRRTLGMLDVYTLLRRHRLPLSELAFKD